MAKPKPHFPISIFCTTAKISLSILPASSLASVWSVHYITARVLFVFQILSVFWSKPSMMFPSRLDWNPNSLRWPVPYVLSSPILSSPSGSLTVLQPHGPSCYLLNTPRSFLLRIFAGVSFTWNSILGSAFEWNTVENLHLSFSDMSSERLPWPLRLIYSSPVHTCSHYSISFPVLLESDAIFLIYVCVYCLSPSIRI